MRLAGVMGWPVEHSLSPRLHNRWLELAGIEGAYVKLPVKPQDVELAFAALPKLGFAGWNVTVPHKEAAFALVHRRDAAAEATGAVNTVIAQPGGSLLGTNTDAYGFLANLKAHAGDLAPYLKHVLVIGAGGAARAVVHALRQEGAGLRVTNRTQEKARALGVETVPWEKRETSLKTVTLLVNASTLGMRGAAPLELSLDDLPKEALVADIVYAPLMTELLRKAGSRGNPIVTGIGMLIHQATPGFRAWFGAEPVIDAATEPWLIGCM